MIQKLILTLQIALLSQGFLPKEMLPIRIAGSPPESSKIEVFVTGLRSDRGTVMVSLFNKANGFPKMEKAFKVISVKIVNKTAVTAFEGLAPGAYGIAVFHDENGNGKMDTNLFGIPKEGIGASNGAKGHFGPPKFEDASFRLDSESNQEKIKIAYL